MPVFEEVYNPDAPKPSTEFDAWWKKDGDDLLMNRTSGENFRYVYWMAHKAYDSGKAVGQYNCSQLVEALKWYEEQSRNCRKLTAVGEEARAALDADGGKKARDLLAAVEFNK